MSTRHHFIASVPPDDPDRTDVLIAHLDKRIDADDGEGAVETLRHLRTAAGAQWTGELVEWMFAWLIALGVDELATDLQQ